MSLADDVKDIALEVGFCAAGVTTADSFPDAERVLVRHSAEGLLPKSLDDSIRIRALTHPKVAMPSARSIISVAMSYFPPYSLSVGRMLYGLVAAFARGTDYHRIMRERLQILAERIVRTVGRHVQSLILVDTPQLSDRAVAMRAGVASQGKNTCVYTSDYGGWIVLGELLTDLDLDSDLPIPFAPCGDCMACIEACPTQAIRKPYELDVKMCLSWATQCRGYIPHNLRDKLGTRIYGCDTCLLVCPLNEATKSAVGQSNLDLFDFPDLLSLLDIGPEEFALRVQPTAMGWIGRTRFRRNVAVALGNIRDPAAVEGLVRMLCDISPILRGHAAWALGMIGTSGARNALDRALSTESDACVRSEIQFALENA